MTTSWLNAPINSKLQHPPQATHRHLTVIGARCRLQNVLCVPFKFSRIQSARDWWRRITSLLYYCYIMVCTMCLLEDQQVKSSRLRCLHFSHYQLLSRFPANLQILRVCCCCSIFVSLRFIYVHLFS